MKVPAITQNQSNLSNSQKFKGKFLYDELNFLPKQLKELETVAKNFDISKKPYDISVYSDPRDSYMLFVAEDSVKKNKCSVTVSPSKQRPPVLDEYVANLIDRYDNEFIKPNTFFGKVKNIIDKINPFSI